MKKYQILTLIIYVFLAFFISPKFHNIYAFTFPDANNDNSINTVDYLIWRCEYSNSNVCSGITFNGAYTAFTPPTKLSSDFNQDSSVDLVDFEIWRQHQGENRQCAVSQVWNGKTCINYESISGIDVVGRNNPITNLDEYIEIEKSFVQRSFPELPSALFNPKTIEQGKQIQDIRLKNWEVINGKKVYSIEFMISNSAKNALDAKSAQIGADGITVWKTFADGMTSSINTTSPNINRSVKIKRIIIVSDNFVDPTRGGFVIANDTNFGYWANYKINGKPGFVSFDIDYLSYVDNSYVNSFLSVVNILPRINGVAYDGRGTNHEIMHVLLPIGDNYVYNFAMGSIIIPQLSTYQNKNIVFNSFNFMDNDLMGSGGLNLTAPSAYHTLANWKAHPGLIRNAQFNPYHSAQNWSVIGPSYYLNNIQITIDQLSTLGISNCYFMTQIQDKGPLVINTQLQPTLATDKSSCSFNVDKTNQNHYPGFYIGLEKNGVIFPVYFPQILAGTFYWKNYVNNSNPNTYSFTLSATTYFTNQVFPSFANSVINGTNGNINMKDKITASFDVTNPTNFSNKLIFYGKIDDLNNYYLMNYYIVN